MKLETKHFGKDRFYVPTYSAEQAGMYKLFIKDRKIPADVIVACLDEYFNLYLKSVFDVSKMSNKSKKYWTERRIKAYTIENASGDNFNKLLAIIVAKTGQQFKYRPRRQRDSYQEWYEQASMDGTLAYNGVADDF